MNPRRKIGHYEILSKIGEGGMGEVYSAQDMKLDRTVAIKFLNQEFNKYAAKAILETTLVERGTYAPFILADLVMDQLRADPGIPALVKKIQAAKLE